MSQPPSPFKTMDQALADLGATHPSAQTTIEHP